jgi:hypothetical protein
MSSLFPMPESLAEGRWRLALDVPAARRKQLGQYFTGLRTGRLLAALAVRRGQNRIVDPMAGHGDLLESAAERAKRLRLNPHELMGVEIEPEAARLGQWRVERCAKEFGFARGSFIHGDAFATTTWPSLGRFDLVITNPPYVRYQMLSNGDRDESMKLLNADETRRALERLADQMAPPEEGLIWRSLIRSYSGLADLSVPSWFLCGLLTAPSGVLALVVPQTWLNRDYARIARYFFLRLFQPLAVVQESGQRWFRDALVPVSLVVGRRLSSAEALIPLLQRSNFGKSTPFAEIDSTAASACSHVGSAFQGDDPEGEFAAWLDRGTGTRVGLSLKRVSWESQRDEVIAATKGAEWLRRLEGDLSTGKIEVPSAGVLPASIAHHLPADYLRNSRPLSLEPIRVGQGLRTGCNAFFYVDVAGEVTDGESVPILTHDLFNRKRIEIPAAALKPVLRKQSELSNIQIATNALRGRLLDLRRWLLPENAPSDEAARQNAWQVMPKALAEYVRRAARTHVVRGKTRIMIPSLSAVKPNGLGPDETTKSPLLLRDDVARMWYMVPDFSPRHMAALCVPRIIHDEPSAILNSEPPVLIDANFSTLWCEGNGWSAEAVFAILNSTWGELCMEALAATLGGGALKLEATHLRQLPVPSFSESQKQSLRIFVCELLEAHCPSTEFRQHRVRIDQMVVSALARRKVSKREARVSVDKLVAIIRSLRAKRRRKHKHEVIVEA